ncbi:sugar phosphate permease [Microbacterium sp. AG1240]|uniref:MFS transporter n=1 Tax=Microbacterium sp. AG1240 TaxID=2183992 RepID=UPI000F11D2AD|nr:MFS transporter [Microbacterium sp. AG1240]RKT33540.1 sugar phosphate permease [Microbacterium sp. AG1240]
MSTPASAAVHPDVRKNPRDARRASLGSYLGATLEFYDFVIYSTASAIVFPAVFFSGIDPALGIVLSYVTLAAGYVARPVGAVVFGHFGDRLGRRQMLVVTMIIMGAASIGIGLIPGSAAIGGFAAVLLVTLRVVQGFAVGGEWAGASLMSIEHAQTARRGFAGAVVQSGGPSGAVLATLTFSLVSLMPQEMLLSWGWRIPFLASAVLVIVAILVRLGVKESPEFAATEATEGTPRVPLFSTFSQNGISVLLVVLTALSPFFLQSLTATFGLQYAIGNGNEQAPALWMLTISNALTIFATLFFAALSDRFGRVRLMVIGFVVSGVLVWVAFGLLAQPNLAAVLLAFIILQPIGNAMITGPLAAYMADLFPVRNRFTGVGVSYQLAATIAAGFAPLVATGLIGAAGGATYLLTSLVSVLALIGIVAVLASRRIRVE